MKKKSVLICGSLCNTDIAVAELLSRYTLPVRVLRFEKNKILSQEELFSEDLKYFSLNQIIYVSEPKDARPFLKEASLIISLTGSVDQFLELRNAIFRNFSILPKTMNITTGSDITELVRSKRFQGRRFLNLLRKSLFNFLNPYPQAIESLKRINIKNFQIIKPPYYFLTGRKIKHKHISSGGALSFLMAANLDWGVIDNKPGRNSTKGNDRFFKAFAKAVKQGSNIKCRVLYRGPDKDVAKKLVKSLGIGKHVEFLPSVNQRELQNLIKVSDIIVDQFDVGFGGGISYESMYQGKPVMVYIDKNCWPLVYDEEPPVINCYTEKEIYASILEWSDRKKLQKLGEMAEKWIRKHHDIYLADFSGLILRICLAADLEWPRKDLEHLDTGSI